MRSNNAFAGNGSGNGNAYGTAAAFGVVLVPVAFIRAFLPPTLTIPFLMFTVSREQIVRHNSHTYCQ